MRSRPAEQTDESPLPGQSVLSASQRRLWILERLHPRNPVHNIAFGVRLTGPLDVEKLERAWCEVVQQYEILRTEFRSIEGVPRPVVRTSSLRQWNVLDLQGMPPEEREAELSRLAREEARRPFDLSSGSLLRASLWRLASLEYAFLLVAHRIVCDEASLEVLVRQMTLCYGTVQDTATRAAMPMQYSEFVSRQGVSEGQIAYWKQQLAGTPSSLELPTDRQRPSEQTFRGAVHVFSIGNPVLDKLRNAGTSHGATLFMSLLAAFNVLLSRYSRQDDVLVGTAVHGRDDPKLQSLVGPIENMIALRTDLSGNPSFSEVLNRVRNTTAEAFAHSGVPFAILLEQLPLERDLSRNPVFQVAFRLRQAQIDISLADEVRCTAFDADSGTEAFDLSLELMESPSSIHGRVSYNADLFEATTIERTADHFCRLLAGFADDPEQRIFDVSPLAEAERRKILVEFNATDKDYRRDLCIQDFFEAQVERTPEATALIFEHERLTYRELNRRANQLAHYLRKQGVGPETLVGLCVERSLHMVVGILGILKAGGAYVPLDPLYPKDRLAAILEDAKAPILLAQQESSTVLPGHAARVIRLDVDWLDIAGEPAENPNLRVGPSNLGYVLFTSGSTGRPKGVALEHRSAAIFIQWAQEVFLPDEVAGTLFSTSMCFDLSVFEIFVPLSMGGKIIIAQNALALPKVPAAREVTLINTVPSAIAELVRMGGVPASVRVVNLAGEALPTSLAQQIYEKTGVSKVYNLYGPTEDTTYSTYTLVPRGGEVTIGRPLPNTQVYILDESRQPLPIGVPGELYLAGDGLARGYFGRDDLTRERFVSNSFARQSGARMYRTGDLARFLEDGTIQYLGRIDNQVKLRGFRIELGEIEASLLKDPSVQSAVVIVREDIPGDKRLVAYVVPVGTTLSSQRLKDLVRQRLPEYMVPSAFVEIKALPLSPNGKVNRRELPAPDWSSADGADVVLPRNELESMLVRIWQTTLGIPKIGIRDNFFDLGGHSLVAARVLSEVEKEIGRDLPLSALFRGATVESLAQLIREREDVSDPVAMQIQAGTDGRLPFFVIVPPGEESLGYAMLARHMGSDQSVYKIQRHSPIVVNRPYTEQEMQSLASEYAAAIRSVQSEGPYCLGGLCDGAHIGERVVLELEAQRQDIALFAVIDTWVMQNSQRPLLWRMDYFKQRLRQARRQSFGEQIRLYKRAITNQLRRWSGKTPARTEWQEAYWPANYVPIHFRAPVLLFKRPKQPFYYVKDPLMGWGARTESGVEVHEIDFDHDNLLREPHVGVLGKKIAAFIERVSTRTEPSRENEKTFSR